MENKKDIFLEFLESINPDKQKFCNDGFSDKNKEKEFVYSIRKLELYLKKNVIKNEKTKGKVSKFLKSVLNNKNYLLYIESEEKELLKQKQEQEKKDKEKSEAQKAKNKITECLNNEDFQKIFPLFSQYKNLLKKYEQEFYLNLIKYPINEPISYGSFNVPNTYKTVLRDRKIKYLVHFTDIKNLESILKNGIVPRKTLIDAKIDYHYNDNFRLDERIDSSCLSVEYPNTFLLDKFNIKGTFCILVLNAEKVLLCTKALKQFSYCNAAREDAKDWLKNNGLSEAKYFHNMFIEQNTDYRHNYTRTEKNLQPYLPTNVQAEILFEGVIPSSFIERICFKNELDFAQFGKQLSDNSLLNKFDFEISSFYFKVREDIEWENR